ncbi:unnamed protein product [Nesidiocoris tenuis]|uniref:Uncharacterized protein n=1 Tax=Nesidiocoris tenuis TaxID=355587 RepID=A0A6H5HLI2_9HEMI|nr:unnamed protein product [Nesidiocoris tenuis]
MVSEVTVGRGCGWIRVAQEPSTQGTLVYLNSSTAVVDVTRELLLSPGLTIWVQLKISTCLRSAHLNIHEVGK